MKFVKSRSVQWSCACAFLLGLSGCGGGPSDADPNLIPAAGKVTLNGQPLSSGDVSFVSQDRKQVYSGTITAGGQYEMRVSPSAPGVLPGEYLVSVRSWETAPTMDESGTEIPGKLAIPEIYLSPDKSGLTVKIEAGGGPYDLDLK